MEAERDVIEVTDDEGLQNQADDETASAWEGDINDWTAKFKREEASSQKETGKMKKDG